MKKVIMLFASCILSMMILSRNVWAGGEDQDITWTIQWKGLSYTGNYSGDIAFGRPNGYGEFRGMISKDYKTDRKSVV